MTHCKAYIIFKIEEKASNIKDERTKEITILIEIKFEKKQPIS